MAFERPTLTVLQQQARADMAGATGERVILRASPLGVLAKVLAGLTQGLYGYLDWIAREANPLTATGARLVAWAALVGIFRKEAASATATATFTGAPGAILSQGALIARRADGVAYRSTASGSVGSGGTVTVAIAAEEPGALGNALAGAEVALAGAASGIVATGVLATAAVGGADQEPEDAFRERMLARYRQPPQGGAAGDYARWAREVPGVTRAWDASPGPGAVTVYVMLDDVRASFGGFPQGSDGVAAADPRATAATGDQLLVANFIRPLQPVTALVYVVAPAPYPVDMTIADLSADTPEIRAAITLALAAMFRRSGVPGGTTYQSDLVAAIDAVPAVERFSLPSPASSVTAPAGSLPVLGTITWPA
ncbi:baseplate J/gp47 family protein [Roseomonas frigidaquae]|uniref:Baseplate J/gp47 family protein n=1 Tax=Falsiroseomonas frigidaquae TaxID=487318 RepID=A0ABX1ESS9_9PROT|nr:baseplate J/gp47 family protein [Falsiroseomonas frigidaquae]NKE43588.1 baseplate J/gp47 family protein [Falsiroseomonas frigidaquae]